MKLSDYRTELVEETNLAYHIDNELFHLEKQRNLTELECEILKLVGMVMQTHQSIVDYMDEIESPERPKGRWEEDMHTGVIGTIEFDTYYFRCSECGTGMFNKNNFCPNCGADMRGDE